MPLKNAQNEARGTRRKQKRRQLRLDPNRLKGSRQDGAGKEDQPLRTGGENWSGHNSGCRLGGTTVGGILRELIDEVDEQSAYHSSQASYHNSQLERLSDRRRHLEQLYQELQAQAGEGGDVESDDKEELSEDGELGDND
jgi:hypothetical protein